jgi:hypothetical protein
MTFDEEPQCCGEVCGGHHRERERASPRAGGPPMIGVEVRDGRYIVRIDKAILVMSKAEFIRCLQAGKRWKRAEALRARQAPKD